MLKFKFWALAVAGAFVVPTANAGTIIESFTNNPAVDGWQVFGDTNLFSWNTTNQNLAVTWDSSQPNSYFYHPLGTILGRDDDFQFSFDLEFNDILAGVNTNKPDAIEVAVGFLNFGDASGAFVRGSPAYPSASPDPINLAEFDYFSAFTDPLFGYVPASIAPTFISSDFAFDGIFGDDFTMTNGVWYHVQMNYTSSNLTLMTLVTQTAQTNILFAANDTISGTNDYRVDTFSISSYSDIGDSYDSLLAHGWVANLSITIPPPPLLNIAGGFTNHIWQVQFSNRSNWVYTLERSSDLKSWAPASAVIPGNGGILYLQDTNAPLGNAFYRVNAQKP